MMSLVIRNICLAALLVVSSMPLVNAQTATQTLGALKPKKSQPAGYPCNVHGNINPDPSVNTTKITLLVLDPSTDQELCWLACLNTPKCRSVGFNPSPFKGCVLFSAGIQSGSVLNFAPNKTEEMTWTSRQCLTTEKRPINPPRKDCGGNPGDIFALRLSTSTSDYRNGYWFSAPTITQDFVTGDRNAQSLAFGSDRKVFLYIDPKDSYMRLSSENRYASYDRAVNNSIVYFSAESDYDPDSRTAIPLKCVIQRGRLLCYDGDPTLPANANPKRFSFMACTTSQSGGLPTMYTFALPYSPALADLCDIEELKVDLIPYYVCL